MPFIINCPLDVNLTRPYSKLILKQVKNQALLAEKVKRNNIFRYGVPLWRMRNKKVNLAFRASSDLNTLTLIYSTP